ncbi:hypothetical protein [Saccharothrix sp. HUAS TT1]|uniref:hypothetical protein n=1 Tax=unclassified Saccharothrix TaxID=2593673 RepID=UPI00345B50DA
MALEHWLTLGGTELVNTARVERYVDALCITSLSCGVCEDFVRGLRDEPYTDPGTDRAPWFDPAVPESALFAGLMGISVEGLERGTGGRNRVELVGDGAAVGGLRRRSRELLVKARMYAKTEAALSYGNAWLESALGGAVCQGSCTGDELCFFAYCPVCPQPPMPGDTCGDDAVRTLFDVGLLDGPDMTRKGRLGDGWLADVQFSLVAGRPHMWRLPRYITGTGHPGLQPAPPIGPPVDCVEDQDCAVDPDCPQPPPPIRPPAPPNPCFPGPPPANDTYRRIATVPANVLPEQLSKVPLLELRTGDLNLRRVTVRFYANPAQYACTEYVDPCSACAEINIPYLPRGVVLRLDGRTERVTVDCPGGPGLVVAEVEVYGPEGDFFEWPVFECDTSLCVEIVAQQSTVAPNMRLDLWMVARQGVA